MTNGGIWRNTSPRTCFSTAGDMPIGPCGDINHPAVPSEYTVCFTNGSSISWRSDEGAR